METTKLSSKGQVIIPKAFRDHQKWPVGLELVVTEVGDGVLIKPKAVFAATTLSEVAACLAPTGKRKSDEDIERALKRAAKEAWRGSN